MANITITENDIKRRKNTRLKSTLWFVALWCVGVGGAMLLALPFKLLIQAAALGETLQKSWHWGSCELSWDAVE
ncbi:MAG: hypothetical protein CBARDCOR_5775 [uncultured Caballeronia sp.]|nr:MAG: hypothetical protein CBARDCOR_5775 [uncultured Caballeronia sp.]